IFCHHKLAPPDTIIIPRIRHKFADKQVDTSCIFLIEEVDNIQYVDILIIEKPGLFAQDFVYSLKRWGRRFFKKPPSPSLFALSLLPDTQTGMLYLYKTGCFNTTNLMIVYAQLNSERKFLYEEI
uniref:hypothetical protein n=1 Tax=[Clostridium] hylemonae TaxID=89153 RepID=UPI001A9B13EF